MTTKIYQAIAQQLFRRKWVRDGNGVTGPVVSADIEKKLEALMDTAPHGFGIDRGVQLLEDESAPNRLVFQCDYHHMDEAGFYVGWTYHKAVVTPDFVFGYSIRITGRDRNQIKEYLRETLGYWLETFWADQ